MEVKKKPPCEFGAKCYRKNPKHFESYTHVEESNTKYVKGQGRRRQTDQKANKIERYSSETHRKEMKQTFLQFPNKCDSNSTLSTNTDENLVKKKKKIEVSARLLRHKRKLNNSNAIQDKSNKKSKLDGLTESVIEDFKCSEDSNDSDTAQSTSWVYIKKPSGETVGPLNLEDLNNLTPEARIKALFLVSMPSDFYSFFEFCKSIDRIEPLEALDICKLKLVGPFDILSGKVDSKVDQELALCHWRFYFDPPEFQTVIASESGFHIGYWRDDPKDNPVFLASNNSNKDCIFKIEAENIFGSVCHYLNDFVKSCDPFKKIKTTKLQTALIKWAEANNFSLEKNTKKMTERQKKVVSKTFHKAGIVVPVEANTKVGYRPLIETDANLKRICNLIMESDGSERESLWENLQPLINAANIANDECDFGNSLELGIDLFSMGSPLFHNTIEHLLSTAYSLLNRNEYERIIRAHLKFRKKDHSLSVFN